MVEPLNLDDEGLCRTIKSQYHKNTITNFDRGGTFGATGVIKIYELVSQTIKLGYMDNGTGQHQSNTVISTDGLSPAITTVEGGGTQQIKILVRS